jgi:hypothetical protein
MRKTGLNSTPHRIQADQAAGLSPAPAPASTASNNGSTTTATTRTASMSTTAATLAYRR